MHFPTKLVYGLLALTVSMIIVTVISVIIDPANATTSCTAGKYVYGGSTSVPLPAGEYDVTVRTWDRYPGRASSWPGDQTSERIAVAGRTTPDLADGVAAADWSGSWRWTSPGTLTVVHAGQPGDADSVSWEVCATPVEPEPAPTTTLSDEQEPPFQVDPDAPIELIPPVTVIVEELAPVAVPVTNQPAFTG